MTAMESGQPDATRPTRRRRCTACGQLPKRPRHARPVKSEAEKVDGLGRQLRAIGKDAEHGLEALASLAQLGREVDTLIHDAVTSLRHDGTNVPASWTEIGAALGITKQSASTRFAEAGGTRTRGGQPSQWR